MSHCDSVVGKGLIIFVRKGEKELASPEFDGYYGQAMVMDIVYFFTEWLRYAAHQRFDSLFPGDVQWGLTLAVIFQSDHMLVLPAADPVLVQEVRAMQTSQEGTKARPCNLRC